MTALLILGIAIVCAYLSSFIVTPALALVLRRIDRYVRNSTAQSRIVPPKLLVYEVPSYSAQGPLTSPAFALAAAVFVLAITVPTATRGVETNIGHYNA